MSGGSYAVGDWVRVPYVGPGQAIPWGRAKIVELGDAVVLEMEDLRKTKLQGSQAWLTLRDGEIWVKPVHVPQFQRVA